MKKMIKEILKDSIRFFGILAILDLLITVVIYQYTKNLPDRSFPFGQIFSLLFTNQEQELVISHPVVDALLMLEKILETILTAILAGFIFSRVINRDIHLELRKTLLLRRRTSEGEEGLNIHVLVGNRHKYSIYDLRCEMSVRTGKEIGSEDKYNASADVGSHPEKLRKLRNYYTFCFPVKTVPNSFWKHYMEYLSTESNTSGEKPFPEYGYWNEKDSVTIHLSGDFGNSGGRFRLTRTYHFKDLVFDKEILSPDFKKNGKLNWKYFQCLPGDITAEEKKDIINELSVLGKSE